MVSDRPQGHRLKTGTIAAEIHPGEILRMLKESNFSADGYRLYLYLEMMALQAQTPDMKTICAELKISRSTFAKWLPQIHEWSHCADWLELQSRQGPEYTIQCRMQQELGHILIGETDTGEAVRSFIAYRNQS
jgi:hypothetical protein